MVILWPSFDSCFILVEIIYVKQFDIFFLIIQGVFPKNYPANVGKSARKCIWSGRNPSFNLMAITLGFEKSLVYIPWHLYRKLIHWLVVPIFDANGATGEIMPFSHTNELCIELINSFNWHEFYQYNCLSIRLWQMDYCYQI